MSAVNKKVEKCAYHYNCISEHDILTYSTTTHSFNSSASSGSSAPVDPTLAELEALHTLIGSSISQIKSQLSSSNNAAPFPSLDTPFTPASEAPRNSPEVSDATMRIVSAAYHMIAIVRHPGLSVMTSALQFYVPAAIRFAVEAHVVEILRDAGSKGLHVDDVARLNGVDAQKLGRILRLLATSHIFTEVSPDVFSNNRISSMLDTGKSVIECLNNPLEKFVNSPGIAPLVVHTAAHCLPAATEMVSAFLPYKSPYSSPASSSKSDHSDFVHSQAVNQTPFNIAFDTDLTFWEWMGEKDADGKLIRKNDEKLFSLAMQAVKKIDEANDQGVFEGFNWRDLPEKTVVVDVGGGVGSQTLAIAKHHKQISVVVQDLDSVLYDANKYWETNLPGVIENGKVKFQPHNFFKPQPAIPFDFDPEVKIYFLHHILHDWSDMYCLKILKNLRETCEAGQDTILIVGDSIIDYACDVSDELAEDNVVSKMPKPLLANGGQATIFEYLLDMQMLVAINGQERTLPQLRSILSQSGWKLKTVFSRESTTAKRFVVAVPF